jgi:hypothetical protein
MSENRLTPEVDLDGMSPDEAFAVLGNEIRLDIVRALWQADAAREYDEMFDAAGSISFSELRREIEVDDNGKFNYHLSQLVPHFVRQTEDGYRLSGAGKRIARTVIAVSGSDVDFSADLEQDCPLCGAHMTATYEDQWLRVRCTECDSLFGDETPEGTVYLANYPAAGLSDRTPDEALEVGLYRCMLNMTYTMHGVCPECVGHVSASVSACDDHRDRDGDGCPACGTPFAAWAEQRCETCGFAKRLPVELFAMGLTPVISFLDDQGIDILAPSFAELVELLGTRVETTVTEEPFRVRLAIDGEAAALNVSLDENLQVADLERRHVA